MGQSYRARRSRATTGLAWAGQPAEDSQHGGLMAVSPGFLTLVEEQLAGAKRVTTKRMFGGVGIYWEGSFFALIDNDTLFFKVNDATRPGYQALGSRAFDPFGTGQRMEAYYEVPAEVLEDRAVLAEWREASVAVANAAKKKGTTRAKPAITSSLGARRKAIKKKRPSKAKGAKGRR